MLLALPTREDTLVALLLLLLLLIVVSSTTSVISVYNGSRTSRSSLGVSSSLDSSKPSKSSDKSLALVVISPLG